MAEFGSLVSDPGMWDEVLKKIVAQMQVEPDRKMPLNQGLMAAGLGMLANSHKGFAGAAGEGGLLGLNAWQQGLQAQKIDPMQQLQMLQAVSGIQERQQKQQALQNWQSRLGGGAPVGPEFGMQDRSNGEMPQPAAPMAGGLSIPDIVQAMARGMPGADKLYEAATRQPGKLSPGDVPVSKNFMTGQLEQGKQIPNLDRNLQMNASGQVEPYPGAPEAAAAIAGATKGAEALATEKAKAEYDLVPVPQGGTTVMMPRSDALAALRGPAQQQAAPTKPQIAPELSDADLKAIDDIARRTGARFSITTPPAPAGRLGVGQTPAEAQSAAIPGEVAKAEALAKPELAKGAQSGANADFVANEYRPAMTQGQLAKRSIAGLDVLDKQSITTGWGTTAKVYGARVLEGLGIAPDKAKVLAAEGAVFDQILQTETFRKLTQENKGPATERDADRAMATFSQLGNTPEGNRFIRAMARAQHNQDVAKAKFYSQNYAAAVKAGNPYELEAQWLQQQKSIFDDPAMNKFAVAQSTQKEQPKASGPQPGTVDSGYRFKGGNPADRNNWERVQ